MHINRTNGVRIGWLCAVLCAALLLVGCGEKYPAVKSTEQERTVLYTASADGRRYEVRYELWRALAARNVQRTDALSDGQLREAADTAVMPTVLELYAVEALARAEGIHPDGAEVRRAAEALLEQDLADAELSYEAFLEQLGGLHVNYEAMMLLYRYTVLLDRLETLYYGEHDPLQNALSGGKLQATPSAVHAFYNHAGTLRAVVLRLPYAQYGEQELALTQQTLAQLAEQQGEAAVGDWLLRHTTMSREEVAGTLLTEHALTMTDRTLFAVAQSLAPFELSQPIDVPAEGAHYLIYRLDKPSTYLQEWQTSAAAFYRTCGLGAAIGEMRVQLSDTLTRTAAYDTVSVAFLRKETNP